jgi:methylase of polypeptide subunit release factors
MAEPAQSPHHAPDNNQRARASNSPPAPTSNRIDALLAWARESLNRLEAELLLGAAAGLERTTIIAWPERALSSSERRRFEPLEALAAGADGLAAIRDIAAELPHCLVPGGKVAIEHGWNQGPAVRDLLHQAGLSDVHTHHDLARLERFTSAQRER